MNEEIEVSIIIPIYNSEKYIEECILSVISQRNISFEVILINDGSIDSSELICKKYANKYDNIHYYFQANKGPSSARNLGIKYARGRYIGFIDADDTIKSDMYFKMLEVAKKYNIDLVMCGYNNVINDHIFMPNINITANKIFYKNEIHHSILSKFYKSDIVGIPCVFNKLYKAEVIKNNNIIFNPQLVRAEDYWFNFEIFKLVDTFYFIDSHLYNYRNINANSIMNTYDERQFINWKNNYKLLLKENDSLKFCINYYDFYHELIYKFYDFSLFLIKSKKKENLKKMWTDEFYREVIKYTNHAWYLNIINKLIYIKNYRIAYSLCLLILRYKDRGMNNEK